MASDNKITKAELEEHYKELGKFVPRTSFHTTSAEIRVRPEFNPDNTIGGNFGIDLPNDQHSLLKASSEAYKKCASYKSIVNFLSEYSIEGFKIVHEDKRIENFYNAWFKTARLEERSLYFTRQLFKLNNVVVRRYFSKVSVSSLIKENNVSYASNLNEFPNNKPLRIPTSYYFYQPELIELVGDEAGAFSNKKIYGLRIDRNIWYKFKTGFTKLHQDVIKSLPKDVVDALDNNISNYIIVPLDNSDIYVTYIEKEDHEVWATPTIVPALIDIQTNSNLKAAKSACLRGFYNPLRLWKLGDHKEGYLPSSSVSKLLADVLGVTPGGGPMDVIWDSMIDCQVFYPPIEKLAEINEDNTNILVAYGFPDELLGGYTKTSSTGNVTNKLKNVFAKIKAVRREHKEWMDFEIGIVHKNMGFKGPKPSVQYNRPNLDDEKIIFDFLIELADRNIISNARVLEILGENYNYEKSRISKEESLRTNNEIPPKAGKYNNPDLLVQQKFEMEKLTLEKENSNNLSKQNMNDSSGRPFGSKDKKQRTRSDLLLTATKNYEKINNLLLPKYLKVQKVSDFRKLTAEQKDTFNNMTFAVLSNIGHASSITEEDLEKLVINPEILKKYEEIYLNLVSEANADDLSMKDKLMLRLLAFVTMYADDLE